MTNDIYHHRERFRDWIEDAKAQAGVRTHAELADVLGVNVHSINKNCSHSETHRPGVKLIKALADYLNRDYRLLLDDEQPLQADTWKTLSDQQRAVARALVDGLQAFPDDQELICGIFLSAIKSATETGKLISKKP
jgi:transcriptional regulator with XRE-family HTH domain